MKSSVYERLRDLITCGYPIFVMGKTVCWPVEAEDFVVETIIKGLSEKENPDGLFTAAAQMIVDLHSQLRVHERTVKYSNYNSN